MNCPLCGAEETRVTNSRLASDGAQVRRRRECRECSERFTTFESAELDLPRVVKSGGVREEFNETKLRSGIMRSLEKRSVPSEQVEESIRRIVRSARVHGEREISSRTLGEWVMKELKALDHVAYIRFASVYRSFQDISEFKDAIDGLERD